MVRSIFRLLPLVAFACLTTAQAPVKNLAEQRLWIAQKSERSTGQVTVRPSFATEHALPGEVMFECKVDAKERWDETHLVLTIQDPKGTPIHRGEAQVDLSKNAAPARFVWKPADLADGEYTADFDLHRRTGGELAETHLSLSLLTGVNIQSRLKQVKDEVAVLGQTLKGLAGSRPAYAQLHVAIVEDYLPLTEAALLEGDWIRAHQFSDYLSGLAAAARLELSVVTPSTGFMSGPATIPAGKVSNENGALGSGGQPVYLFGAAYRDDIASMLPQLERYGLRFAVYRVTPIQTLADGQRLADFAASLESFLADAERRGVNVVLDAAPENLPAWAQTPAVDTTGGGSFNYDLMAEGPRRVLERHLAALASVARMRPNVVSISLADDPALRLRESTLREGLIQLAKSRYTEYDAMNRRWRTRYMSFDEVQVDWTSRHTAYLYDLQTYHQELGTQLFAWLADLSRKAAPELSVQVQLADNAFEQGESMQGIDRESILSAMDFSGTSSSQSLDGGSLAIGPQTQAANYALLRSLNPDAPVINTSDSFQLTANITGCDAYGRLRAMMWEGVMAGLSASAMRLGAPGTGNDGILARPELIDAYATTNLDINRLAPIVTALQQAPAPVRILWSPSSKMFNRGDPYVDSAMRAYEGCANFGPRTLFISERECERNGLNGVDVLVIPKALALSDDAFHAIERFVEAGGVTIRQGNPFPYDRQGISRTDTVTGSKRTILLRSEDSVRAYLDALDAAYALDGLNAPPRPVNEFDYPIDGVKSRFAVHERVPYLYIVNLREEPVHLKLTGGYSSGMDLISGNHVNFPDNIEPLTPMVIQLDTIPQPEKVAVVDSGVQTVELTPVVDEAELKKQQTAVQPAMRHGR